MVGWARGLLDIYNEKYNDKDCIDPIEDRTAKSHNEVSLELSPVPVSDIFYVRVKGEKLGTGNITLVDVTGRTLLHKVISNENAIQLDLSTLENGYYVIRYENEYKVVITESLNVFH